jgi:hypothetical protein
MQFNAGEILEDKGKKEQKVGTAKKMYYGMGKYVSMERKSHLWFLES